jgi:hypothetical protein
MTTVATEPTNQYEHKPPRPIGTILTRAVPSWALPRQAPATRLCSAAQSLRMLPAQAAPGSKHKAALSAATMHCLPQWLRPWLSQRPPEGTERTSIKLSQSLTQPLLAVAHAHQRVTKAGCGDFHPPHLARTCDPEHPPKAAQLRSAAAGWHARARCRGVVARHRREGGESQRTWHRRVQDGGERSFMGWGAARVRARARGFESAGSGAPISTSTRAVHARNMGAACWLERLAWRQRAR